MAKVSNISAQTKEAIQRKSAYILPNNPTEAGFKASDIRNTLFKPILDATNSALAEVDRVINEINEFLEGEADKIVSSDESGAYGVEYDYTESDGKYTITKYKGTKTSITIPKEVVVNGVRYPVVAIGALGETILKDVIIPKEITTLGTNAFKDTELDSVTLEKSYTLTNAFKLSATTVYNVPKETLQAYQTSLVPYVSSVVQIAGYDTIKYNKAQIDALFTKITTDIGTHNTSIGRHAQDHATTLQSAKDYADKVREYAETVSSRVETIITTPVEGASAQEIIDARAGEVSLGDKIRSIDTEIQNTESDLLTKANTTDVDTALALKADKTTTDALQTTKADKSYVDTITQSIASGAPKGTYSTLVDLETAFPTGDTNIYLVTANGNWYFWNGSAWISGGVYQGATMAADKANILDSGGNYDSTNVEDALQEVAKIARHVIKPFMMPGLELPSYDTATKTLSFNSDETYQCMLYYGNTKYAIPVGTTVVDNNATTAVQLLFDTATKAFRFVGYFDTMSTTEIRVAVYKRYPNFYEWDFPCGLLVDGVRLEEKNLLNLNKIAAVTLASGYINFDFVNHKMTIPDVPTDVIFGNNYHSIRNIEVDINITSIGYRGFVYYNTKTKTFKKYTSADVKTTTLDDVLIAIFWWNTKEVIMLCNRYSINGEPTNAISLSQFTALNNQATNIFDGKLFVGSINNTTGELTTDGNYRTTDFIPIKAGQYFNDLYNGYTVYYNNAGFIKVALYNENKEFVSGKIFNYAKAVDAVPNQDTVPLNFQATVDGYIRVQGNTHQVVGKEHKICLFVTDANFSKMGDFPSFNINQTVQNNINDRSMLKDIVSHNEDIRQLVDACAVYGHHSVTQNVGKLFTLLVTTDVHNDTTRFSSAIDYLNSIPAIDAGICLGDMAGSYFNDTDGTWYTNLVNTSNKPFYTVIGNHDAGNTADTTRSATKAQQFAKWIEPTLAKIGDETLTKTYYSVNTDYGVTLIVLDFHDLPDTLDGENFAISRAVPGFSQAQINWLITTLAAVPTGNHVVISAHSSGDAKTSILGSWTQTNALPWVHSDYDYANMIPAIVNAWISGTTLSETYVPTVNTANPTLTVSADFTSRGAGVFACYLIGHAHIDNVSTLTAFPTQKVIMLSSTANDNYQNFASDLPRTLGTKAEDCITLFTVDKANSRIKLCRVGSNKTFNFVDRTTYLLSY